MLASAEAWAGYITECMAELLFALRGHSDLIKMPSFAAMETNLKLGLLLHLKGEQGTIPRYLIN